MKQAALTNSSFLESTKRINYSSYIAMFFSGLSGSLGFAPFHMPGLTIISLALLFAQLLNCNKKQAFSLGFIFGLGYFSLGVSWVIVSIHDYGQLNYFLSGLITLSFIAYLSLFPALVSWVFKILDKNNRLLTMLLFSCLWCLSEYCRATLFNGFPWLLVGVSQIDTPLKYLAPILGIYGLSFLCAFLATLLTVSMLEQSVKRFYFIILFILIMITPSLGKYVHWTQIDNTPISVGAVQPNLSMRDKWDEALFWKLLKYYEQTTESLLGKQLIIFPESAIPLPASYLEEYLLNLHNKALKANSSLLLGILQPTNESETSYYNSIISLGQGTGEHVKQQLVPFGEYIPNPFVAINKWFDLPEANIMSGKLLQNLINISTHPIASLICYEISYPDIVRSQMPMAHWIVSISDNGWFGRSLASYQQLQMAQMLSLLTGRYQVVVNNDGLSSLINETGNIIDSLPPFSSGVLQGTIYSAQGITPWIIWSEYPALFFSSFLLIFIIFLQLWRITKQ